MLKCSRLLSRARLQIKVDAAWVNRSGMGVRCRKSAKISNTKAVIAAASDIGSAMLTGCVKI